MSESYRAILVDGNLHWLDDVPKAIQHGAKGVRVRVTVEEQNNQNEEELGALLDEIADADPFSTIDEPVEWQRKLRRE